MRSAIPIRAHRVAKAIGTCAGAALLLWATACSEVSKPELAPYMELVEEPLVPVEVLRERAGYQKELNLTQPPDSFFLFHASDVDLSGSNLVVVDNGNDRLVVFDTTFTPLRTIGRSGAGPGELDHPFFVAAADDSYWAVDMHNMRLSGFGLDGRFIGSAKLKQIGPLAIGADRNIYIGARYQGHYMTAVDRSGGVWPFASQQFVGDTAAGTPRFAGVFNQVAATGDTIHFFDDGLGILMKFGPQGDLLLARMLPPRILTPIRERNRKTAEALARQGHRVLGSPLAKSMKATDDGRLLLMLVGDDPPGLLIDASDYSARPVRPPTEDPVWQPLSKASTAILRGNTMYVLVGDGLVAFRVALQDR